MQTPGTIFEPIEIEWNGKKRTIHANRVLKLIAQLEDVLTLTELHRHSQAQNVPFAKLAMAYGLVLRYAGLRVTDDEIYATMFNPADGTEKQAVAIMAVQSLLQMMLPPSARKKAEENVISEEEQEELAGKPLAGS